MLPAILGSLAKQLYQTELTMHEASVNHTQDFNRGFIGMGLLSLA
jgi:hypothetical protein